MDFIVGFLDLSLGALGLVLIGCLDLNSWVLGPVVGRLDLYISEVQGKFSVAPLTGKSASFRSCVRASEDLCARERVILQPLGRGNSRWTPALVFSHLSFADRCWGFKRFYVFLLTGAGVLRDLR